MSWERLQQDIVDCRRCPRLRKHCRAIARDKRAAYRDFDYWGRPVPNFTAAGRVRLLIVGLAPGAHGANRTGRMFTGDRSGDFLFKAMHAVGFANQPGSVDRSDGLELIDCAITAVCHCAPPDNKPTPAEIGKCRGFLEQTVAILPEIRGFLALGRLAFDAVVKGLAIRAAFAHGAVAWSDNRFLIASYHPSQQNTFTGKLTLAMLTAVFSQARRLIG